MESRSQSDSDGGGGHHRWSPPLSGTLAMPHDEGRPQPPQDPGLADGQHPPAPTVLSLQQIRITRGSNEYTEGPTAAQRSPASQQRQQKAEFDDVSPAPRTNEQQKAVEERPNHLRNPVSLAEHGSANLSASSREGLLGPPSADDTQSGIRTSMGSTSSGHRLLGVPSAGEQIIRTQPECVELTREELKPLNEESGAVVAVPGSGGPQPPGKHREQCEECGRCRCPECSRPRLLPSCWLCGHRCVCSAHSAVDYGTCVCCIKGLFYHCSSDDEDTCADKPFSCAQAHCCVRWATVSLLSILFPCILCYLPAKGCVAMLQSCYDRVARPGCRCKNTNPIPSEAAGKPA